MDDGPGLHGLELVNFCRLFSFTLQPVHSIHPLPCLRPTTTYYSRRGWGMSYKQSRLNTPLKKQSLALLESGG
jgi:hypothetical protein